MAIPENMRTHVKGPGGIHTVEGLRQYILDALNDSLDGYMEWRTLQWLCYSKAKALGVSTWDIVLKMQDEGLLGIYRFQLANKYVIFSEELWMDISSNKPALDALELKLAPKKVSRLIAETESK